jgi:hypothetical protein
MKAIAALFVCAIAGAAQQRDYPVKPVPFTAVHVNDAFWAPRIETNRTVTIPRVGSRRRRSRFRRFSPPARIPPRGSNPVTRR